MRKLWILGLMLSLGLATGAGAGPVEDAQDAGLHGDYATAQRLLQPAAEQGNSSGQSALGAMYFNDDVVPQDYVQAYLWSALAAREGSTVYADDLDRVAREMTPAQIAQAKALVRHWKPKPP